MFTRRPGQMGKPLSSVSKAEELLVSIERKLKWLSRTKRPEFVQTIQELEQIVAELRTSLRALR